MEYMELRKAFTNKPFSGNPAAVCVMDKWPSEEFMKNLAMENNLSETFVTHKHVDHLMGIIWMVRMICQFMNHGEYKGDSRGS